MTTGIPGVISKAPLHAAVLASFAISQPLFDVLGRSPDFLLAHDLTPLDIGAVIFLLGVVVPALAATIAWSCHRVHPLLGRVLQCALVSLCSAILALIAINGVNSSPSVILGTAAAIGMVCGVAYDQFAAVRSFVGWLAPGLVLFPLLFIARPGVQRLVWPLDAQAQQGASATTPVVMVVFDGLSLPALLDETHQIDARAYPSFAALAAQSTWYRNTTSVSDYTRWAMPAIVSGEYPRAAALPVSGDHPQTIFTLMGASHEVRIQEPISRLCPPAVCEHHGTAPLDALAEFVPVLAVSYLHTVFPESLEERLAPVDQGWAEGVPPSETPGQVWLQFGDNSRRGRAMQFIEAIQPTQQKPSFDFLHVLLPHTPLAYLPGGQRYGTERYLPGLVEARGDRWLNDEWAVVQGQQRYLLQAAYVDTLLGQLIAHLKKVGLYDRALVVVTSDHGASFKPGQAFRRMTRDTFMDVMPVPLLIKKPFQTTGVLDDRNMETVDILPTVADILNVDVPWPLDGVSAIGERPEKTSKTVYFDDARQVRRFGRSLLSDLYESLELQQARFGSSADNFYRIPRQSPRPDLIGRDIDDLRVSEQMDAIDFVLDVHGDFSNVDPRGRFVPVHLGGFARWRENNERAAVAIAVNGVIRATTRTFSFGQRGGGGWSAMLPTEAFRRGNNDVEVFVFRELGEQSVLHRAHVSSSRPMNLISIAAAYSGSVTLSGFYDKNGAGEAAVQWTDGDAAITVPMSQRPTPRSLRVVLADHRTDAKSVAIDFNGCELFNGMLGGGAWSQILDLSKCPPAAQEAVIGIRSGEHTLAEDEEGRPLGVPVRRVQLLNYAWPPDATALPESARRSQIVLADVDAASGTPLASTASVTARVVNRGSAVWATPKDLGQETGSVRFGALWFQQGRTEGQAAAIQRVELPASMVPTDELELSFKLAPPPSLPQGTYEVWLGLFQEGIGWFYESGDSVRKLRVVHDARS